MDPRSELQHSTWRSSRPPPDHYQNNPSEAESSDGDDDDIPARKPPGLSPSKRVGVSATGSHANPAKRSLSNAAQGGIVLYPGSKRQRNGYNMRPVLREHLPHSASGSPRELMATAETPSHTQSLSASSGDNVFKGLVSSVNMAFRDRQTRPKQHHIEQHSQQVRSPVFYQLDEAQSGKPEHALGISSQGDGLPLTTPTSLTTCALPLNFDKLKSEDEGVDVAPNEEDRRMIEAHTRVNIGSLSGDIWEMPDSPSGSNAWDDNSDATHPKPHTMKKRGRPPKLRVASMAEFLPVAEPNTGKKKRGRPRKHYPRLRNETDKDYITRIARLRKQPIPFILESDTHLFQNSFPIQNSTNSVQLIDANVLGQSSEGSDANASTCASVPAQDQGSKDPPLPCRQTDSNLDNPPLSQDANVQLQVGSEEGVVWPENHAESDGNLDERSRDLRNDDLGPYEPVQCDDDRSTDSATLSESLDGFDTDLGGDIHVGHSSEYGFEHDVDVFNARQTRDAEDDEVFEGPSDDDVLAIHLDHQPLRQMCKLLGDAAWTGARSNWQWRDFDHDGTETAPARALLSVLAKLERLYQATPKAPDFKAQNQFLREHANMLGYYFHKIKIIVEHIRVRRLEISDHNEATQNSGSRKRKRMTRDLVSYVIPMLAHVFTSAWGLGGETWTKTSFTGAAVELLGRTLGWIMQLHRPLLRELERCPLEEKPENHHRQQAWRRRNIKREEIAPLLDNLFQVIAAAPDQLAETEARAREELQRRQRQLTAVAERKKRSLLSIHGIHYRRGVPTTIATSTRPSLSLTLGSTEWSSEEQRLLFLRIQASFPSCPDLNTLCWELNKTAVQTAAMTEHILERMLTKVLIGYSVEERTAELHRIMRSSGVAGL